MCNKSIYGTSTRPVKDGKIDVSGKHFPIYSEKCQDVKDGKIDVPGDPLQPWLETMPKKERLEALALREQISSGEFQEEQKAMSQRLAFLLNTHSGHGQHENAELRSPV